MSRTRHAPRFEAGTARPAVHPGSRADLETILSAWHDATLRLEQTHEALRGEVRRLTDELEVKNRELARKNRLADLGQMASHIAHEVRNNLVPVTLYLSLLRRRIAGDEGSLDVLEKISAGFTALDVALNDLLHFTTDREPKRQTFSLSHSIENVYTSLAPQLAAQSIELEIDVPPEQTITADEDMHIVGIEHFTGVQGGAWSDNGHILSLRSDNPWTRWEKAGTGMEPTGQKGYFGYCGRDYYCEVGGIGDVTQYEMFPGRTYFFVPAGQKVYLHCYANNFNATPKAFHHTVRLLYW